MLDIVIDVLNYYYYFLFFRKASCLLTMSFYEVRAKTHELLFKQIDHQSYE